MAPPRQHKVSESENSTAFSHYRIDSSDFLDTIQGRSPCPLCTRSRKYFCYTCFVLMPPLENRIPQVKLPVKVSIIKHPQELDGKSTSTHGPLLAREYVDIYTYPSLPADIGKSILVFPSAKAEDAIDFLERTKKDHNGLFPYNRIIFIDSTWNQTNRISNDAQIAALPRVKLCGIDSLFWRYQRGNPTTHLSTIEAVYHFVRLYHLVFISPQPYLGEYDNLLFFFRFMFYKIRQLYDPKRLKCYSTRPSLQK